MTTATRTSVNIVYQDALASVPSKYAWTPVMTATGKANRWTTCHTLRGSNRFGQVVKTETSMPYIARTPRVNAVVDDADALGTKICAMPTPMSDPNAART
ncbi:MAG: hypothetical protein QOF40_2087 [Actinomycetota bacterium]|nr:hypothetical protein [Actinomycetota bacterium]